MKRLVFLLALVFLLFPFASAEVLKYDATQYSEGGAVYVLKATYTLSTNSKVTNLLSEIQTDAPGFTGSRRTKFNYEDSTTANVDNIFSTAAVFENLSATNPNPSKFVDSIELYLLSNSGGHNAVSRRQYVNGNITNVYITLISPADSFSTVNASIFFNMTGRPRSYTNLTNATIYVWDDDSVLINSTTNTYTGETTNSTSWNINVPTPGQYSWNVYSCVSNTSMSGCSWADSNYSFIYGFADGVQTFNTQTYDTARESFLLNSVYNSTIFPSVNIIFIYNNTQYTPSLISSSGNDKVYGVTFDIPIVTTTINNTFYWQSTLINSTGSTFVFNSSLNNQTVSPSSFIQCGAGARAVNYTIYDESAQTLLTSNFDATFTWRLNESSLITKNISYDLSGANNYQFCINTNRTFFTDAYISLSATGYHDKVYTLADQQYTNATTHQKLFLLNNTVGSNIIIELKDTGLSPLIGYTVKVFRTVTGTGERVLVAQDVTDSFGQITATLVENTVKYQFEFYELDGDLVKSTGDTIIACRSVICVLPFVIDTTENPFDRYGPIEDLVSNLTFNNDTNIFLFTWTDTTGDGASYNLVVERILFNGTTIPCDTTSSADSGVISCSVGDSKASYRAQVYRTVGTKEIRIHVLNVKVGDLSAVFGLEGLFWSFILLFTFIIIGIFSPAIGVIVYLVSLIMLGFAGIIYINPIIIISQIVIGVLFIWAWRG